MTGLSRGRSTTAVVHAVRFEVYPFHVIDATLTCNNNPFETITSSPYTPYCWIISLDILSTSRFPLPIGFTFLVITITHHNILILGTPKFCSHRAERHRKSLSGTRAVLAFSIAHPCRKSPYECTRLPSSAVVHPSPVRQSPNSLEFRNRTTRAIMWYQTKRLSATTHRAS